MSGVVDESTDVDSFASLVSDQVGSAVADSVNYQTYQMVVILLLTKHQLLKLRIISTNTTSRNN